MADRGLIPAPRALMPVPVVQEPLTIVGRIAKFLQPKTSPALVPSLSDSNIGNIQFVTNNVALSRQANASAYRSWASTPWVFSAINIRKNQIASADWDIVPFDNTKRVSVRLQQRIRDLFNEPSAKLDSFQSFASTVIDDMLTLDAGVIEKVRYPDRSIAELWPTRGEWIAVDERWDGSDPERPRYYFVPDGTIRDSFTNDDMLYMIANPRANSSVGLSPMAILASTIDSELQAMEYNRRMVMGAAPNGALNIGDDASPEKVTETASFFQNKVFGQSAMAVIGGFKSPSYLPFNTTNREMQFREWQDLLIRCIAVVLGLAPMDLGITFDVNRSTAEQGAQNTDDRGLRPLMSLFQNYMTREIVWDKSFGGKENNLAFVFRDLNISESAAKAAVNRVAMPGVPWKTINEARKVDGRAPMGDVADEGSIFNSLLTMTPKGMLNLSTQEYIGEDQLAKLQQETATSAIEATAENAPEPVAPVVSAAPTGSAVARSGK